MKVRWIHTADVHLGYYQYGLSERALDFARAFKYVADYAIRTSADFLIIAGDLFHRRNVDALTLGQAYELLSELRAAEIPVLCVEGNHERAYYNSAWSWLNFLSNAGFLYLLSPSHDHGRVRLEPWDEENRSGGYVDLGQVRVSGIKYYGASAPTVLEQIAHQLSREDSRPFSVMMLHEGLEGQLPRITGGLSASQLEVLRPYSEYLALGHIHKQYDLANWAFNPGSLETCSVEECSWERGFYEVTADTETRRLLEVKLHSDLPRRAFVRVFVEVERFSTPRELLEGALRQAEARMRGRDGCRPVLEVSLIGTLQFSDSALSVTEIEERLREEFDPLVVRVKNSTLPAGYDSRIALDEEGQIDRRALELQVLTDLVLRDARYADSAAEWAAVFQRVKDMALDDLPPQEIFRVVERGIARKDTVAHYSARSTPAPSSQEGEHAECAGKEAAG